MSLVVLSITNTHTWTLNTCQLEVILGCKITHIYAQPPHNHECTNTLSREFVLLFVFFFFIRFSSLSIQFSLLHWVLLLLLSANLHIKYCSSKEMFLLFLCLTLFPPQERKRTIPDTLLIGWVSKFCFCFFIWRLACEKHSIRTV